ncbi:nucleotide kinase domain-containing protein [Parasphingopyxis lamellibrachiae]|uniref:5-hmdU DNA kinase helical domain-containing protein n=1 Tax=Parasphingopyxis lamellibrachiae TaxID=680125 RepID=A0A3D9F9I8_9SPHN|nr:nucleotide kinase domain-containing protein [Parasphingopyxis lamellibrachiae]RED11764.1 hypothetical protein DFR46_2946 [Parasphingopyxis lamellibrachiae]
MLEQHELFHSSDDRTVSEPDRSNKLTIRVEGKALETTEVFAAYWRFAAERQQIFAKRLKGTNDPALTDDSVLCMYRFTNSYRASDRVSQFLLRNVIWNSKQEWSDEDVFYRTLLFKLFNKIDTWEALEREVGELTWARYDFGKLDTFLSRRQASAKRNYSAAYIMPSAGTAFGHKSKHANHLRLLEWMIAEDYPRRLRNCQNMGQAFDLMIAAPSVGPFLAYQFVTDINYSTLTSFSEMEFVKAGPGALDGIAKCFKSTNGVSPEAIIKHVALHQDRYFDLFEIDFPSLWGRPLQLIDCQNLFCETSKYARVAFPKVDGSSGRTRIKQKFAPAGRLPLPFYPPDWGLNEKINIELGKV